jgi:hypothetical protein
VPAPLSTIVTTTPSRQAQPLSFDSVAWTVVGMLKPWQQPKSVSLELLEPDGDDRLDELGDGEDEELRDELELDELDELLPGRFGPQQEKP